MSEPLDLSELRKLYPITLGGLLDRLERAEAERDADATEIMRLQGELSEARAEAGVLRLPAERILQRLDEKEPHELDTSFLRHALAGNAGKLAADVIRAARRWSNAAFNHGGEGTDANRKEMNEAENDLLATVDALDAASTSEFSGGENAADE